MSGNSEDTVKTFAPGHERGAAGNVIFPRDKDLRASLFPYSDPSEHVAKANMHMVKALVEFVSEPGDTILDPFAGTGTILVALTLGRKVMMIEIEDFFVEIIERNIEGIRRTVPDATELTTLIPGDCSRILPLQPGLFQHMIFSPPYGNIWKKTEDGMKDATYAMYGYESSYKYSQHPDNVGRLNDFFYMEKMEKVYSKCAASLLPGGTMTVIIKDRIKDQKVISFRSRLHKDCARAGLELVADNVWFAPGGAFANIQRMHGYITVDEEHLITFRKASAKEDYQYATV